MRPLNAVAWSHFQCYLDTMCKVAPRPTPSLLLRCSRSKDYQFVSRCVGHTGSVQHLDWSLPMDYPGEAIHEQMVLQTCDNSGMLLSWDPRTGKGPWAPCDACTGTQACP